MKSATVGISAHAAEQLGEIVYVELPEVEQELEKGGECTLLLLLFFCTFLKHFQTLFVYVDVRLKRDTYA